MTVFVQDILVERPDKASYDTLESIHNSFNALQNKIDITKYRKWISTELGIGCTPLRELPDELNPYQKDGIQIYYKPEYLNRGGSGKGRSVSFLLYYYKSLGLLKGIKKITTAGFGNFIRALADVLPFIDSTIVPQAYMGRELLKDNKDLVDALLTSGVELTGCDDDHCPSGDMERGKAIALAYADEQVEPENTLFLDQHGVFKPFNGLLNAAGYYYTLAAEISSQIKTPTKLYYVNGEGTRGSLVGTSVGLKTSCSDTEIVGLRQQEGGLIFGLRSLSQLGKSTSLGTAEELCDVIYEISDKEAYCTMTHLWGHGIPATPSGGSHIAGALRQAEALKRENKEGTIVTMIFDSFDYYRSLLEIWMPRILGKNLDSDMFEMLRAKTFREREQHIENLMSGKIAILPNIQ